MASEKPCVLKGRYPPGTIINAGGIYLFNYFCLIQKLGKNSVSPEGINTEPSRGQRKIKRGKKIAITYQ